jgi:hypothetical protein
VGAIVRPFYRYMAKTTCSQARFALMTSAYLLSNDIDPEPGQLIGSMLRSVPQTKGDWTGCEEVSHAGSLSYLISGLANAI